MSQNEYYKFLQTVDWSKHMVDDNFQFLAPPERMKDIYSSSPFWIRCRLWTLEQAETIITLGSFFDMERERELHGSRNLSRYDREQNNIFLSEDDELEHSKRFVVENMKMSSMERAVELFGVLAKQGVKAEEIKEENPPIKWVTWAKMVGYDVSHIEDLVLKYAGSNSHNIGREFVVEDGLENQNEPCNKAANDKKSKDVKRRQSALKIAIEILADKAKDTPAEFDTSTEIKYKKQEFLELVLHMRSKLIPENDALDEAYKKYKSEKIPQYLHGDMTKLGIVFKGSRDQADIKLLEDLF